MRGLFYGARILLILWASLIVVLTTTSNALVDALVSFLRPLRRVRVPVDDLAMIISIALRFIPLTAEEFMKVKAAQVSRGGNFDTGSLWKRISAWFSVLIPLVAGLFHRADILAQAMDSRCYGAHERTSLLSRQVLVHHGIIALLGIGLCIACTIVW